MYDVTSLLRTNRMQLHRSSVMCISVLQAHIQSIPFVVLPISTHVVLASLQQSPLSLCCPASETDNLQLLEISTMQTFAFAPLLLAFTIAAPNPFSSC